MAGNTQTQFQDVLKVYLDGPFSELLPFFCFYLYQGNYSENGKSYEPVAKKSQWQELERAQRHAEYLPHLKVPEEIKAKWMP